MAERPTRAARVRGSSRCSSERYPDARCSLAFSHAARAARGHDPLGAVHGRAGQPGHAGALREVPDRRRLRRRRPGGAPGRRSGRPASSATRRRASSARPRAIARAARRRGAAHDRGADGAARGRPQDRERRSSATPSACPAWSSTRTSAASPGASAWRPPPTRSRSSSELMRLVPRERWVRFSHQLIAHGRAVCRAPRPRCADCFFDDALCPSRAARSWPRDRAAGGKPRRRGRRARGRLAPARAGVYSLPVRSCPGSPPGRQKAAADSAVTRKEGSAGDHRPEPGDPPRQGAGRQGRVVQPHRAHPGRERRRQGARGALDPQAEPAARPPLRRGRLRDAQREPPAERALRPPEGGLHRRDGPQARPLRGRRHRDALPRRDRRGQPDPPGQAAAGARDRDLPAPRQHRRHAGRRAPRRRDQPRPAAR